VATVDGATVLARCLKTQGVDYMFGIVGFPVQAIATAAQREGIRFIGMRNEQAASYAARAAGYLTGRPQACLTVTGPGVIHAIAGLADAQQNCWPMILIGGASPTYQIGMGSFQEESQVSAVSQFCKYAAQVDRVSRIPFYVEQAVRTSFYGRPGAVHLDMPDNIISGHIEEEELQMKARVPDAPRIPAMQDQVDAALSSLKSAERPLLIVGKGMAWARAEDEVRSFVDRTQMPFLATPMGKGVVPDDHPLSVGAARSYALRNADVIFLMGARLNWMLHYGLPPRYDPAVRFVQLDIEPEAIGLNVPAEVALVGDGKAITAQLNQALEANPWEYPAETRWRTGIADTIAANRATTEALLNDDSSPMNYYRALRGIRDVLPRDSVLVNEGAGTMDIGRQVFNNYMPRTRLDAGTYGTMGVGSGSAIAAAVVHPDRHVFCVQGDSAFGFGGMEVETAIRHNLPITFIIINNNGIGGGPSEFEADKPLPPGAYTPQAHYERMAECFGSRGFFVERTEDLAPALKAAMAEPKPAIVNVMISNRSPRKPQEFTWASSMKE
jgi:2-hydroxyacyl-CoA lyase 1